MKTAGCNMNTGFYFSLCEFFLSFGNLNSSENNMSFCGSTASPFCLVSKRALGSK